MGFNTNYLKIENVTIEEAKKTILEVLMPLGKEYLNVVESHTINQNKHEVEEQLNHQKH